MKREKKKNHRNKSDKKSSGRREKKGKKKKDRWELLYESIVQLREESRERGKKVDERIDRLAERVDKLSKQVDRISKDVDRVSKEVERVSKEVERVSKDVDKVSEEVDRMSKEMDKIRKDSAREAREFRRQVANLMRSLGFFVEGAVEPSVMRYMREKGYKDLGAYPNLSFSKNGKNVEYDLIVVSPSRKTVLLVSAKSRVCVQDVKELEKQIASLPFFVDWLKGYNAMGAVAGMSFARGAKEYAKSRGFIIFKVGEEFLDAEEPEKIKIFKI